MKKINFNSKNLGFTLIELLVVVAIIGLLAAIVMAFLNNARSKGGDAAIKSNMKNSVTQAEIFFGTNTSVPNAYTGYCTNIAQVGGANTISTFIVAASKVAGLGGSYTVNGTGTGTTATCNDSAGAWAAEVPLTGSTIATPIMWCVDSVGKSKQEPSSIGAGTTCA